MNTERLNETTQQVLRKLETENVIDFIQKVNAKTFTDHAGITSLLVLLFFIALWRWTRVVLLFFFTLISMSLLIKYTLPPGGIILTIRSTLPFVLGCMGIASVLLYFIFIRSE